MFAYRTKLLESLQGIRSALNEAVASLPETSKVMTRLAELSDRTDALERSLALTTAEAEATLLKASGKFNAARSAEERTKTLAKTIPSAEDLAEGGSFDAYIQAAQDAGVQPGDGKTGPPEQLPAVQPNLGNGRDLARSAKWTR